MRYADCGGYRFCYAYRGKAGMRPSILMLHGFSAHKDAWLTVVKVTPVFHCFRRQKKYLENLFSKVCFLTFPAMVGKCIFNCTLLFWTSISQSIYTFCVWTCPAMKEQHAPTRTITPSRDRPRGFIRWMACSRNNKDLHAKPFHRTASVPCPQFVEAIRLNRKPFHLVGTSMGGNVAGVYAACYPSEICSMTLICPDGQSVSLHMHVWVLAAQNTRFPTSLWREMQDNVTSWKTPKSISISAVKSPINLLEICPFTALTILVFHVRCIEFYWNRKCKKSNLFRITPHCRYKTPTGDQVWQPSAGLNAQRLHTEHPPDPHNTGGDGGHVQTLFPRSFQNSSTGLDCTRKIKALFSFHCVPTKVTISPLDNWTRAQPSHICFSCLDSTGTCRCAAASQHILPWRLVQL